MLIRALIASLVVLATAAPVQAQMSRDERERMREDMNRAGRDVYKSPQPPQRGEAQPPGGRMSPDERERLRRDMRDANRGIRDQREPRRR